MYINQYYVSFLMLLGVPASIALALAPVDAKPAQLREVLPWPVALRSDMERMAGVEWRLRVSAAALCPAKSAGFGLRFDHIGAYDAQDRKLVRQVLQLSDAPQVAVVIPGSPGDRAGIRPGDELLAIGHESTIELVKGLPDSHLVADAVEKRLALSPDGKEVELVLRRGGEARRIAVRPEMLCAVRNVLKTGPDNTAYTDGSEIAVPVRLLRFTANDDELALIMGHELGHIVSRHGKPGSLSERRLMEDEADALGAALAYCAGYDIGLALDIWRRYAKREAPRWLRSATHRPASERARRFEAKLDTLACPVTLSR